MLNSWKLKEKAVNLQQYCALIRIREKKARQIKRNFNKKQIARNKYKTIIILIA